MLPAIFPDVQIVKSIPAGHRGMTVSSLCERAGIECRVTGPSARRKIHLLVGQPAVSREPGSSGSVSIRIPDGDERERAILALGILAYAVFDYAARESMRGRPEARMSLPPGRPRKPHPLSGAERMRRWRSSPRD
jgi:hypothetical protein